MWVGEEFGSGYASRWCRPAATRDIPIPLFYGWPKAQAITLEL